MDKETQNQLAEQFADLLRSTGRSGIEELILYLQ